MTPKEKAKQLVDKFKEIIPAEYDQVDGGYDLLNLELNARQAAVLIIDEILSLSKIASLRRDGVYMELEYWIEVKQEIEKL